MSGEQAFVPIDDISEIVSRYAGNLHFLGLLAPPLPGLPLFITALEYYHFPPGTASNEQFLLSLTKWRKMIWCMASIPPSHREIATSLANQTGLIFEQQARPVFIGPEGEEAFPVAGQNVFYGKIKPGLTICENRTRINAIERAICSQIHQGLRPELTAYTDAITKSVAAQS